MDSKCRRSSWWVGSLGLVVVFFTASGNAAENRAAFERELSDDLQRRNPEAVAVFVEANAARDRRDAKRAAELYARVRELAPGFSAATRRLCSEELTLGHVQRGQELCRVALSEEQNPENQAVLALALVERRADGTSLPAADVQEASRLMDAAEAAKPNDPFMPAARGQIAMRVGDVPNLKRAADRALDLDPSSPEAHALKAVSLTASGMRGEALDEADRARALGLSPEGYAGLRAAIVDSEPIPARIWRVGSRAVIGWALGLVVLLGLGAILSRMTLASAMRGAGSPSASPSPAEAWLRRVYRVVLWACCFYYYLSLPLVIAAVLVAAAVIIYGVFAIGYVPIKLLAIVVIIAGVSVWAIVKSVFARVKEEDPGERLDLGAHPRLKEALVEVAGKIGTRPVDTVFLTAGTQVAVFERGGLTRQLTGRAERCLVLGAGVLSGMRLDAFKAVLAHEYGHFHNEDTAGGGFALAVRRSLLTMAMGIATGGGATWFNPAWLFLNGFHRVFLRISQGASRLQEILADRWAAFAYGSEAFVTGLRHVIERTIRFDAGVGRTLEQALEKKYALVNLYADSAAVDLSDIDKNIEEALNAEPSVYDSHPAPKERIAWVRALGVNGPEPASEDAWSLFADREVIERRLTAEVWARVEEAHAVHFEPPPGAQGDSS